MPAPVMVGQDACARVQICVRSHPTRIARLERLSKRGFQMELSWGMNPGNYTRACVRVRERRHATHHQHFSPSLRFTTLIRLQSGSKFTKLPGDGFRSTFAFLTTKKAVLQIRVRFSLISNIGSRLLTNCGESTVCERPHITTRTQSRFEPLYGGGWKSHLPNFWNLAGKPRLHGTPPWMGWGWKKGSWILRHTFCTRDIPYTHCHICYINNNSTALFSLNTPYMEGSSWSGFLEGWETISWFWNLPELSCRGGRRGISKRGHSREKQNGVVIAKNMETACKIRAKSHKRRRKNPAQRH